MRDREATAAMRALAERQHGVVAHRQLLALGLGEGTLLRRYEGGLLIPIHRGVYALGHRRLGRESRWMAAVLACGPGAVLSHASAAHLWGLRGSRGAVEVLRRSGGARHAGIRLHQTRRLDLADTTTEKGIPVTSIERTLLDMAGRLDAKQVERVLVAADRSKRLRWPELGRVLQRRRGRKGAGLLRRIAIEVDPRAAEALSPSEVDFLALCRHAGIPIPMVNVLLEGHLVDFLWPRERVVVETDSWGFHGDRPSFENDHEVTVELVAAGFDVHRATYRMLSGNPGPFLANVRRALRQRTASSSPSRR
ncbi:MAG: type IV toxin-antitoxin system AbiEi family antitoxin domain-containing protein [Solirubrobacterales bacterium]